VELRESEASVKIGTGAAGRSLRVSFDSKTFSLTIAEKCYRIDELESIPLDYAARTIVIDATTMEFPEMALLLYAYRHYSPNNKPARSFIYAEPAEYVKNAQEAKAESAG
jgi:hypothetical protein